MPDTPTASGTFQTACIRLTSCGVHRPCLTGRRVWNDSRPVPKPGDVLCDDYTVYICVFSELTFVCCSHPPVRDVFPDGVACRLSD